ncbi:MAG: cell division protein FtsZ [Candidatus Cloacimonetes bacterium]|nr:cell division protein FtsZ [Candidatus Cloacimonadota bacterium]
MLEFDRDKSADTIIKIIGVGGAGGNAINTMIEGGLEGVEFIAANTDGKDLRSSSAKVKLQLGLGITRGLGTGANPEVGRDSALESKDDIRAALEGAEMVFIAAGMGGGTGTGAAPVIASIAREMDILTMGIVTRPFGFEGFQRRRNAEEGLTRLRENVDTLIVIPNEKLNEIFCDMTILDAFRKADNVLFDAAKAVSDIINHSGYISVDFADVKTVMAKMGYALMGTGIAEGENRAIEAARAAISNPLLADVSLDGCKAILINITGGTDMLTKEFDAVSQVVVSEAGEEANVIVGLVVDETMSGKLSVTIIATGLQSEADKQPEIPKLTPKSEEKKHEQLDIIFDRIRQADNIGHDIIEESLEKQQPRLMANEKIDIPAFMRKFTD